jgi:trigger factor
MPDETKTEPTGAVTEGAVTEHVHEHDHEHGEGTANGQEPAKKLHQDVIINDAGPCRKHIKVTIPRADIDDRLKDKFNEMMPEVSVPGYRPGKAPRKLIEKRFLKDVSEQLKGELLLQSLEQLAEDHHLNPIAQPDIDPFKIDLPADGPLSYEFEVEVAPEFDLPQYRGLKLKRPVKDITDADVASAQEKFLRNNGTLVTKDGPAALGDHITADVVIRLGDQEISKFDALSLRIDPQLAFKDGIAEEFGARMTGVRVGEARTADIKLSQALADQNLRGKTVTGSFAVTEVKQVKMPDLTPEFLQQLGVTSEDQLKEKIRIALQRQLQYEQRRQAREQVLQHIAAAATWDLPRDLLQRQARNTFARRLMELRQGGFSEDEIRSKAALLQQDSLASTSRALKEQFVLQKIAETEKIDVNDDDVDFEIESIAAASDESPRKVRARIERDNLMETLMTQIIERKALDLVLDSAEYEDVPFQPEQQNVGAVEAAATGEEVEGAAGLTA